jgi:hypothetical protein
MSKDEQRHRIPTSDELEQQGALTPASAPTTERRAGLLRFFRTGRFRVSDDVAARKHVGVVQTRPPVTAREGKVTQQPIVTSSPSLGTGTAAAVHRRPADPIVPRKIRIEPSVKERRGLGRPHDDRESGS